MAATRLADATLGRASGAVRSGLVARIVWCLVVTVAGVKTMAAALEARIDPEYVPVVEQVFRVVVTCPPGTPLQVEAPAGVALVDRSAAGSPGVLTRLYFRASRPLRDGHIRVRNDAGGEATVELTVRSYADDITAQLERVPGLDPAVRKQGRSYYTDQMVAVAQDNVDRHPQLRDTVTCPPGWLERSDDRLWDSLPSWNVPRQCYSNWPCPDCGEVIFKTSGFYPWQRDPDHPFRAQCPECKVWYPSNTIEDDDFTSGPHPDDGWGWDPGSGKPEDAAGWVAYYTHHSVWRPLGDTLRRLSLAWLLEGDERAAHQAGVLLARLAVVYPGMNMRWQQVRTRYRRPGRLLIDGNWERNEILVPALRAYDAVWDYVGSDERLAAFLHDKDPGIETPDDVRALLDRCLVQLFAWDWMRRELSGGNQGAREEDFAQMILCAGMPSLEDVWLEELFTHAYNSGINKGGVDDESFVNNLSREGATLVSGLGYAMGYLESKSDMAETLSRVTHPDWEQRCNLYDAGDYPKLRAEYDLWLDLVCAGQFMPAYGDSGGGQASRYPKGPVPSLRLAYERAYRRWPTDRLARALDRAGRGQPTLFEPDVWTAVQEQARAAGPEPPQQSRVRDGIGFAVLESRPEHQDLSRRAAVAVRYGYALGHHHQDNLNIEFWAHGDVVMPELGYPCWAHPMGNTSFVAHHITGMIDHQPQYRRGIGKGALEGFAVGHGVSFVDVSATPSGFPNRVYRRALCLVDTPEGVYLLDIMRLAGGSARTFCAHGPGNSVFDCSADFGDTVPGGWKPEVMPGELPPNLVDASTAVTSAPVSASWTPPAGPSLRLLLAAQPQRTLVAARCAKTDIPAMRYLFAEDHGADGASEFVALWEPVASGGSPAVTSVSVVEVEGGTTWQGYRPVAVRVTLSNGRVDTLVYAPGNAEELRLDSARWNGHFAYWNEDAAAAGDPPAALLYRGGALQAAGQRLESPSSYEGRVRAVSWADRTVTLDPPLAGAAAVRPGTLMLFRFGPHRSAYHIASVADDGATVTLDCDGLIYRGTVLRHDTDPVRLHCEVPPRIPGSQTGYYDGAWLQDESGQGGRIVAVDGAALTVDGLAADSAAADENQDGRRRIKVYDIGPGDRVTIPLWTSSRP